MSINRSFYKFYVVVRRINDDMKSLCALYLIIIHLFFITRSQNSPKKNHNLEALYNKTFPKEELERLNIKIINKSVTDDELNCICIICDNIYLNIFQGRWFNKIHNIPYIITVVKESEDLLSPNFGTLESIRLARKEGCKLYIIFLANGLQASRLLKFGDKYRVINTRAKFIMLHDQRLFESSMHYIWKRIINVIFIKHYVGDKSKMGPSWFELSTVPYPFRFNDVLITQRIETWKDNNHLRLSQLFPDKTYNLKGYNLQVVILDHIPAVIKQSRNINTSESIFDGIEINIIRTVAEVMKFKLVLYEPDNAMREKWGHKYLNGSFSGLLGEMLMKKADIALGNLHYIPYHLELIDLSIPYITQCLTFLTPESLTDNSWKTLILPFKLYMWVAVFIVLFLSGFIFYGLAKFHQNLTLKNEDLNKSLLVKKNGTRMDVNITNTNQNTNGLYLFGELINSILYTYGMLLVISLPKLPPAWSMRLLTGWYWLYCVLVVVSYRASMTAILANPTPRITIDTMKELAENDIATGGWGDQTRNFFLSSLDEIGQKIGLKFKKINDADFGIKQVARGKLAYYENVYYLKYMSIMQRQKSNYKEEDIKLINDTNDEVNNNTIPTADRNLHIMKDCAIHMPISVGLEKNSPIKPKVDLLLRSIIEAGLIKKWLNDVMTPIIGSLSQDEDNVNALMTLQKLYVGFVALFTGYIISILVTIGEILHWQYVVKKDPDFDKFALDLYYVKKKRKNK